MHILLFCPGNPRLAAKLDVAMKTAIRTVHNAAERGLGCATFDDLLSTVKAATFRSECNYQVIVTAASWHNPRSYEQCQAFLRQARQEGITIPIIVFTDGNPRDEAALIARGATYCLGNRELNVESHAELLSAVLMRLGQPTTQVASDVLSVAGLVLNTNAFRMLYGKRFNHVTAQECKLLVTIMGTPDRVFSREQLMNAAYGPDGDYQDRTIDSHIKRIREKMRELNPSITEHCIITIYGGGYAISSEKTERAFPVHAQGEKPVLVAAS